MADYVKTISVSLRVFGPEPTEKFRSAAASDTLVWGSDYWGYGTVGLEVVFGKGISNSFSVTNTVANQFQKYVPNTLTVSGSFTGLDFYKGIAESAVLTSSVGKDIAHYYTNSVGISTTVGLDFYKAIYNSLEITTTVSPFMSWSRTISESFSLSSTIDVYEKRGIYDRIYGGVSSVVAWPRASVYTQSASPSDSFTRQTPTTTTWSRVT